MAKRRRPKPVPIRSARARALAYRRWRRWWAIILQDIQTIAHHRALYRDVRAMVQAKTALQVPSVFYDWMQHAYVTTMTVAIRRLVDWDRRSVSFVRLMDDMIDHPEVMSRRRFVSLYRNMPDIGVRDFQRYSRPGARRIDPAVIRTYRRDLLAAHERLRVYVNKHVAHRSLRPMRRLPTYNDLDRCVDVIESLAKRYSLVLQAVSLVEVVPTIQGDWREPFRVRWI